MSTTATTPATGTLDHAATVAAAVDRLNAGDVEGYMTILYAPAVRFHGYPDAFPPDHTGIGAFYRTLVTAVPDARVTPCDILADGDRLAIRYTLTGTHQGELFGAPGTGRSIDVEGLTVLRFEDGQVVERWNRLDDVGLLQQIGVLPPAR